MPPRRSTAARAKASPPSAVVRSALTNSTPSMGPAAPAGQEALDGGAAETLGAAADEDAFARELVGIHQDAHAETSMVWMASPSSSTR